MSEFNKRKSKSTEIPEGMTAAVLEVNGDKYPVVFPTHHTLLEVLREECNLTGTVLPANNERCHRQVDRDDRGNAKRQ